jgi:hypothetical protein
MSDRTAAITGYQSNIKIYCKTMTNNRPTILKYGTLVNSMATAAEAKIVIDIDAAVKNTSKINETQTYGDNNKSYKLESANRKK